MRKIILILITIYIICSCGRQKAPSPFFVWKPTDAAFDSVTQDLERAYCFNYNKDNILRLTRKLDDMAKADAKSPVKKGRAHFFKARFYDSFSSYTTAWNTDAEKELQSVYDSYPDTAAYPYDMLRIRYVENKIKPRSIEQEYFTSMSIAEEAHKFGDPLTEAGALNNISYILLTLKDSTQAISLNKKAAGIFHSLGMYDWELKIQLPYTQYYIKSDPKLYHKIIDGLSRYSIANRDTLMRVKLLHLLFINNNDVSYIHSALRLIANEKSENMRNLQAYYESILALDAFERGIDNDSICSLAVSAINKMTPSMMPEYSLSVYRAAIELMRKRGDIEATVDYFKRYERLNDSIVDARSHNEVLRNIATRKIAEHKAVLMAERSKERIAYLAVILAIIIIGGIVVFYLVRRQNRLRMSKLQAELALTQNQLQLASSQLVVKENENVVRMAIDAMRQLVKEGKVANAESNAICNALKAHLNKSDELEAFGQIYERVSPNFAKKLKATCPKLTEGQLRMAEYVAMGMDNRQISRVMMIEYKSVITARYRLRSILKLSKEDSLEDYLRQFTDY